MAYAPGLVPGAAPSTERPRLGWKFWAWIVFNGVVALVAVVLAVAMLSHHEAAASGSDAPAHPRGAREVAVAGRALVA